MIQNPGAIKVSIDIHNCLIIGQKVKSPPQKVLKYFKGKSNELIWALTRQMWINLNN